MSKFNFCGPSYSSQSLNADAQATINWYPEQIESGDGNTNLALYPTPGLKRFCQFSEIVAASGLSMQIKVGTVTVTTSTGIVTTAGNTILFFWTFIPDTPTGVYNVTIADNQGNDYGGGGFGVQGNWSSKGMASAFVTVGGAWSAANTADVAGTFQIAAWEIVGQDGFSLLDAGSFSSSPSSKNGTLVSAPSRIIKAGLDANTGLSTIDSPFTSLANLSTMGIGYTDQASGGPFSTTWAGTIHPGPDSGSVPLLIGYGCLVGEPAIVQRLV